MLEKKATKTNIKKCEYTRNMPCIKVKAHGDQKNLNAATTLNAMHTSNRQTYPVTMQNALQWLTGTIGAHLSYVSPHLHVRNHFICIFKHQYVLKNCR